MHSLLKAFVATLLAIGIFLAGALTAGLRHWFQPIAQVTVRNESDQRITNLRLFHKSAGLTSVVTLPPLAQGQSKPVRFFIAGEGEYTIEAQFADGKAVSGGVDYIESGYVGTAAVSYSSIQVEGSIFGY